MTDFHWSNRHFYYLGFLPNNERKYYQVLWLKDIT